MNSSIKNNLQRLSKNQSRIKKYLEKKEIMYKQAREKFPKAASKKCSNGHIMKEGYKISSHKSRSKTNKKLHIKTYWIKPTCIKSQTGKSVKSTKLITIIDKGILEKYGYTNIKELTKTSRKKSLKQAIQENIPLSVYRRLIAIATLNKNKDIKLYKILREDAKWIKTQPEYISKKASKKSSKKIF